MRRRETSPEKQQGTTEFSRGLGFRINKLHLSYGRASLFPGYTSNQFSLLFNMSEFDKKS